MQRLVCHNTARPPQRSLGEAYSTYRLHSIDTAHAVWYEFVAYFPNESDTRQDCPNIGGKIAGRSHIVERTAPLTDSLDS